MGETEVKKVITVEKTAKERAFGKKKRIAPGLLPYSGYPRHCTDSYGVADLRIFSYFKSEHM